MAGLYRGCAGVPALSLRQVKQIEAGSQVCNYTAGAGRAPRESTGNQPICGNSKRAVEYGSLNTIVGYGFEQGFWQRGRRSVQVGQERIRSGGDPPDGRPRTGGLAADQKMGTTFTLNLASTISQG